MSTKEFVERVLDLGFDVEQNELSITVYVLSGRKRNIRNKIAWVFVKEPGHMKLFGIGNELKEKEKLLDLLVLYTKSSKTERRNNRKTTRVPIV